ncbi:MAG: helix-turn-helix transcriptional regulator [Bacteroidota bacterium]
MSYLSKNFKTLRLRTGLSQYQFGRMFGLTKENIKSYENGAAPKYEKFFQIMDYFELDPERFFRYDMEHASLKREAIGAADSYLTNELSTLLKDDVVINSQLDQLDALDIEEIKDRHRKLFKAKEALLKEHMRLVHQTLSINSKYIQLLEDHKNESGEKPKKETGKI